MLTGLIPRGSITLYDTAEREGERGGGKRGGEGEREGGKKGRKGEKRGRKVRERGRKEREGWSGVVLFPVYLETGLIPIRVTGGWGVLEAHLRIWSVRALLVGTPAVL